MSTIWSFDLGKASIGEAVRDIKTDKFLHVASLLIPAEFASTKDAATRRRMWRTRQAHKAREAWLDAVWRAAGQVPLQKREVWRNPETKKWELKHKGDERLEREFARKGDSTCYTSCLLRIKLLRGEKLEPWQIYKALHSAIQKRGYGRVPWAAREVKRGAKTEEEVVAALLKKDESKLSDEEKVYRRAVDAWPKFKQSVPNAAFHFPSYYDAANMGLWSPNERGGLKERVDCTAGSTRKVRFDRADVEREIIALAREAATQLPSLSDTFTRLQKEGCTGEWQEDPLRLTLKSGKTEGSPRAKSFEVTAADFGSFLVHGPAGEPSADAHEGFTGYLEFRTGHGVHPGSTDDWLGATGQKTPRFDNRIVNDCALISRLQVCGVAIRLDKETGKPYPDSLLASEVTFLMKLKNTLVNDGPVQRKLTPNELRKIFTVISTEAISEPIKGRSRGKSEESPARTEREELTHGINTWPGRVASRFSLTKNDWGKAKGIKELGLRPVTNHEVIKPPKAEGRSRFSRPALRLVRALILSGQKPSEFLRRLHEREPTLIEEIAMDVLETEPARFIGENGAEKKFVRRERPWVLVRDLKFLEDLARKNSKGEGDSWENLHFPEQRLDALEARHADEAGVVNVPAAVSELLGGINDPIVRHRLHVFAEKITEHHAAFGVPEEVVLEFVREDFMGEEAKGELRRFQNERAKARQVAKERASELGVGERSGALKFELFQAQGGECLYCQQELFATNLADYRIEHIVPRQQGGPDAMVNYVLAHESCNDEKGRLTPFQWKHGREGWDAYEKCVTRHAVALRNKKVQLLLREDAPDLVGRYTALAETAWISRLAQKIVSLHFGWRNGNDFTGPEAIKRVTVVSGGLTARIRRRYRLNSLLAPVPEKFVSDALQEAVQKAKAPLTTSEASEVSKEAAYEWESVAEKNREDDRHHALDAMVINFWNTGSKKQSDAFFRFPPAIHQNARAYFERHLKEVKPRRIVRERILMEETLYGKRVVSGATYIVKRRPLVDLATKVERNRLIVKPMKDIKPHKIVDGGIRRQVEEFLRSQGELTLDRWSQWCDSVRLGGNGARIEKVLMTETEEGSIEEYGNFGKAGELGRGQYRKAGSHAGYFILTRLAPTKKEPNRRKIEVHPVFAFQSEKEVASRLRTEPDLEIIDYFWSNCQVALAKEWEFKGQRYPADEYTLKTLWAQGNAVLKHGSHGFIGSKPKHNAPIGLRVLVEAGIQRVKSA